jgi:hypothetical protein
MKYKEVLEIIFQLASIFGIGILIWYTFETFKIRKASDLQNKTLVRPLLIFAGDPTNFTIKNATNNPALNVVILTKINGNVQVLKDGAHISAIGPMQTSTTERSNMIPATFKELKQRMPHAHNLFDSLRGKETQCLIVIYDDLHGSHLYTMHFGSGGEFGVAAETGYIKNIRL